MQAAHRLEPVDGRVLEIGVEAHVVEGEEAGAGEAEGHDEQEPVLRRVERRRRAHHAQDRQRLQQGRTITFKCSHLLFVGSPFVLASG